MKFTIIIAVLALAIVLAAGDTTDSQERIYCGRKLAETLAYLCDYGEDTPNTPKRSGINDVDYKYYNHAWLGPHMAHAFSGSRGKRGVVTECCDKACSLGVLLTYC